MAKKLARWYSELTRSNPADMPCFVSHSRDGRTETFGPFPSVGFARDFAQCRAEARAIELRTTFKTEGGAGNGVAFYSLNLNESLAAGMTIPPTAPYVAADVSPAPFMSLAAIEIALAA